MNQRGLGLTGYLAVAIGVLVLLLGLQTKRLDDAKQEHAAFVAQTKILGEVQEQETKATDDANKHLKERLDAENTTARAALAAATKRLSGINSGKGLVPPAAPSTSRSDLACFDRAELDNAIREFTGRTGDLVIEGESATIDLNTAKAWASGLRSVP